MSTRQAYKTEVEVAFNGSEYFDIDPSKVIYIVIEHMYEDRVMPVIYICISMDTDLYSTILDEKDSAKIFLRIQKYNAYSNTSLSKDYIKGEFSYFLSSTMPEYSKDLSDYNTNVDSNYKTIVIGLLDMAIMNTLRKTFGGDGTKKGIDQHTLVYEAVEDTKIVMKTPDYNLVYDNLYIPPITSRKAMLEFIFDTDPFYDTEFMYFIDFDVSYLLDRTGEAVSAGDGQLDDVIIDVQAVTMEEAYNEGMEERNGSYYININPANTNVSMDVGTDKIHNQLVAASADGAETMDLDINRNVDSDTKQTFRRLSESSAIVYKNAIETSQVCIELVKENIDPRYITPNKCFSINNYEGYDEYNGKYLLLYKKEVIQGATSDFASMLTIGVKKLGNIQKIGKATSKASQISTKARSTTARAPKSSKKTSSSSKKPTTSKKKVTTTSSKKK